MAHFKFRFLSEGCDVDTLGLATDDAVDFDRRRFCKVNGPAELLVPEHLDPYTEKMPQGTALLQRHIGHLARNVYSITVDDEGLLVSVSTDPEDDNTEVPHYPRYSAAPSLQGCSTIELSKLTELDRLGCRVDLVSYIDGSTIENKVVFKMIPEHPHLISWDRIVIDNGRVIGFTTPYVDSQSFDIDKTRVFRLEWLRQLFAAVDYLNLELGITHQDISPQNILIDPETNTLKLFDYSCSTTPDQPNLGRGRNDVEDVIFTVHEIITGDYKWRDRNSYLQKVEAIQGREEWPQKAELDCSVAVFREHLDKWVQDRKETTRQAPHRDP